MTIYLDLDGPVLDVADRFHGLHSLLVSRAGRRPLDRAAYWKLKQVGRTEADICRQAHPGIDAALYARGFAESIERPEWLALDRPAPGVPGALRALASGRRLVLVTLRRRGAPMRSQLAALGLDRHFERILQEEDNEGSWRTKARLIASDGASKATESLVVGDSEAEIQAARALGLPVASVCCGMRSRGFLQAWEPDRIVEDLSQLARVESSGAGPFREATCARW